MSKASNLAGFVPSIGIRSDLSVGIVTASKIVSSNVSVAQSVTAANFYGNGSGLTGAGSTVADDTSTNATFYPVITQTTSGTITASKVSTTKLSFNPSTGTLNSSAIGISGSTIINSDKELGTALKSAYDTVTAGGSTTISNRTVYYVTSDSQTVTLPPTPDVGNEVVIMVGNYTGVVVGRNGSNIMSLAEDMTIDVAYASLTFIFVDPTRGWVVV